MRNNSFYNIRRQAFPDSFRDFESDHVIKYIVNVTRFEIFSVRNTNFLASVS